MAIKPELGKPFKQTTILSILKNIKYTGTYFYNKLDRRKKKERVIVAKYDEVVIPNAFPRIISDEDFEMVQTRLANRASTSAKTPKPDSDYLLTGLMFCKTCGASYHGRSKIAGRAHKKYYQYICSTVDNQSNGKQCAAKPISKDAIELLVAKVIVKTIKSAVSKGTLFAEFQSEFIKAIDREILNYQNSINATLRKQNQIVSTMIKVTDDDLLSKLKDEYQNTKLRIDGYNEAIKAKNQDKQSCKSSLKNLKTKMENLNPEELVKDRANFSFLVKKLIKRIEIGDNTITIKLL